MERVKSKNNLIVLCMVAFGGALIGLIWSESSQFPITTEEKIRTVIIESGSIEFSESEIPTLETIDGGEIKTDSFSIQGSFFRTDTYEHFIEDTENKCVIEGNVFGAQCVSLAQAFWTNYAGRSISDCGTGTARGIWECKDINAGSDFVVVEGAQNLQAGDWAIFDYGRYGHVGMVYDSIENDYIPLYGENQGGKPCEAGGSQPNFVKLNHKTLLGAFRPKDYIKPEPIIAPDGGLVI